MTLAPGTGEADASTEVDLLDEDLPATDRLYQSDRCPTIGEPYEHRRTRGTRFLVERLWPRGIREDSLHFSDRLKDVAPSDLLRRWFRHDVAKWVEFQRRYRMELNEHPDTWAPIAAAALAGDVVLLYSAHDTEHNNAVVLRGYVNERLDQGMGAAFSYAGPASFTRLK